MTDSATVVEFEPALVAVTIEALTVPPGWRIQPFGDSSSSSHPRSASHDAEHESAHLHAYPTPTDF